MLRKYYANRKLVATCELCEPAYQSIGENTDMQAWGVNVTYKPAHGDIETHTIYGEDAIQATELAIQFLHAGIEEAKGLAWLKNE